jgi:hypothetical protein
MMQLVRSMGWTMRNTASGKANFAMDRVVFDDKVIVLPIHSFLVCYKKTVGVLVLLGGL